MDTRRDHPDTTPDIAIESQPRPDELAGMLKDLNDHDPKVITNFVPGNAAEAKKAFLAGDADSPGNRYDKLDDVDFDAATERLEAAREFVGSEADINPKYRDAYLAYIDRHARTFALMRTARDIANGEGSDETYMALNKELYGEPDESVYRQLIGEKIARIDAKSYGPVAERVRDELHDLTDGIATDDTGDRFKPSDETVRWTGAVVEGLYAGLLRHVPEQDSFDPDEVRDIITNIFREEFGEAADGWRVDVEKAQSINVKASEKRIVIPEDRGAIERAKLRGLICHEVGVHMLRSVTGESTDMDVLKTGLAGTTDSEEGLGMMTEQALKGKFGEAGTDHYITIGLAHFGGNSFRETFEIKWRLAALSAIKSGSDLSDEQIERTKGVAYNSVMRTYRGTDRLPLFKDLAYYNGSANIWKYLEDNRGDEFAVELLFMGKADPTKDADRRLLLETRSL